MKENTTHQINWYYDIYKTTEYRNGNVIYSYLKSWSYNSLKEAMEYCKQKHWCWPFYYIVRRINGENGKIMYKP